MCIHSDTSLFKGRAPLHFYPAFLFLLINQLVGRIARSQFEARSYMALRLLVYEPNATIERHTEKEATIMDWILLGI